MVRDPEERPARPCSRRSALQRIVLLPVAAAWVVQAPRRGVAAPRREKSIVVSLSWQTMAAYKGDRVILSSYVSTGKAGFETPPGSFRILTKLPSETMAGVIGGESYHVPDVPSVMYFTTNGHALHGAYWHASFGTPMSHGCINLPLDVAAWLYAWAPLGAPVHVVP